MKKFVVLLLMITLITATVQQTAHATEQDNDMLMVLKSGFYGGLTGALIGTAFLAFRDKPSDHTDDIRIGAGVGVIVGTLYGFAKTTQAFVQVHDNRITFHLPAINIAVDPETQALQGSVNLLNIPF